MGNQWNSANNWISWEFLRNSRNVIMLEQLKKIQKNFFIWYNKEKSIILTVPNKKIWYFFNCPRIDKNLKSYWATQQLFFVLYNNFFHVLLSFIFDFQKDFYGNHDDTDVFYLFLLEKDCLLFFSSSQRFWYLSQASLWSLSLNFQ